VDDNSWNYYTVQATTNNDIVLQFSTSSSTPSGDCDVYVKRGQNPTRTSFDYRDIGFGRTFNLTIDDPADYTWYIGVYGYTKCEYTFLAYITGPINNSTFSKNQQNRLFFFFLLDTYFQFFLQITLFFTMETLDDVASVCLIQLVGRTINSCL
jgi:hypothetical protein